jgi:hypothetical protein
MDQTLKMKAHRDDLCLNCLLFLALNIWATAFIFTIMFGGDFLCLKQKIATIKGTLLYVCLQNILLLFIINILCLTKR